MYTDLLPQQIHTQTHISREREGERDEGKRPYKSSDQYSILTQYVSATKVGPTTILRSAEALVVVMVINIQINILILQGMCVFFQRKKTLP